MIDFLKPKVAEQKIPTEQIIPLYKKWRFQTLLGIIIG